MIYDLEQDHEMLTPKVKALDDEPFAEQVNTAEALLGLIDRKKVVRARDVKLVLLALAHQVNFQVEQGVDPLVERESSSSHTRQSVSWRDRWVNPVATSILAQVPTLSSGYSGEITSVRNQKPVKTRMIPRSWYRS